MWRIPIGKIRKYRKFITFGGLTVLVVVLLWLIRHRLYAVWQWHPLVGFFIAILGLLGVLVPFLREHIGKREKALWTAVFCLLLLLEFRSMYLYNQDETAVRDAQFKAFKETIDTITGGDSFAYLEISNPNDAGGTLVAVHKRLYPLYGVGARFVDLKKYVAMNTGVPPTRLNIEAGVTNINIGDLIHDTARAVGNVPFDGTDNQQFNIFFSARNGLWTESLRVQRKNSNWYQAIRVLRRVDETHEPIIFEQIDPDYPGPVDWK
jgi:hypothetical protein